MTTLNLNRTDILTIIDRVDEARKINNDFDIDLIINSMKLCNEERMDFVSVWNPEKESKKEDTETTSDLTIDHKLQIIIYAWLWEMRPQSEEKVFRLY